jgi:triphosphatase
MVGMSTEIELKFQISPQRLASLRRAVATRSAVVEALAAVYFDTPDQLLARNRIALRLRREGTQWVQTLKAEGASAMQRLEHNVALPEVARPVLDLSRHQGSEAAAALQRVLAGAGAGAGAELGERYATEVQRTRRVLRRGDWAIEVALDEGRIVAGQREQPICEIEFELLEGAPQHLLDLAARWVDRFGLVLDMRSKSERGHWLAAGRVMSPPTRSRPVRLPARAGPAQAVPAMLAGALDQVLANASQIGAGPSEPEHLHQLRVGLRRLRTVLRVFGPLAPSAAADLAPALAALFGQLGAQRDLDAMAEWLLPALQAAGAPAALPMLPAPSGAADQAPPAATAGDIAALLRAPATQRLWLAALAAAQPAGSAAAGALGARTDAATLRAALRAALQPLMRQIKRDARRFAALDDAARHRLRRRLKRLRYAAESVATLWPAKAVARTLRGLQQAQTALGEYNDSVVAQAHCRAWAEHDGRAWFAVGWLSARRQALEAPCGRVLAKLAEGRGFWRKS